MHSFRTELKILPEKNQIDYTSKTLLLGSCFTQNIGEKLSYYKFDALSNPCGVLFHPLAIEKTLCAVLNQEAPVQENLFFSGELWHSFQHSLDFSSQAPQEVLNKISRHLKKGFEFAKQSSHLILSLGTAWCYEHKKTNQIVANCHKIPQKAFEKKLLSVSEIVRALENIKEKWLRTNPSAQLIFTVSPVRHLKEGMVENNLSKSHLLAAVHQVTDTKSTFYFPAYEIVMDDLRDYRFFKKDLLHPNQTAIDYLWMRFKEAWVKTGTEPIQKQVDFVQKGMRHKAFHPDSEAHKKFLSELAKKKENLQGKHGIVF